MNTKKWDHSDKYLPVLLSENYENVKSQAEKL
jgi:hypothetical protein